ncbi:hypothetical protein, partial [Herbaspirillum sp. VT-16-41]|uniref:hypothetical protein n=1 Tax=Herbaspirillum sp. VT-16-41 TaxID=1953765 RepID=UPI001C2C6A29
VVKLVIRLSSILRESSCPEIQGAIPMILRPEIWMTWLITACVSVQKASRIAQYYRVKKGKSFITLIAVRTPTPI